MITRLESSWHNNINLIQWNFTLVEVTEYKLTRRLVFKLGNFEAITEIEVNFPH